MHTISKEKHCKQPFYLLPNRKCSNKLFIYSGCDVLGLMNIHLCKRTGAILNVLNLLGSGVNFQLHSKVDIANRGRKSLFCMCLSYCCQEFDIVIKTRTLNNGCYDKIGVIMRCLVNSAA